MQDNSDRISATAARRHLSESAVRALSDALAAGHGGAQWNHPDLGGMGQWSSGGMIQIGDMFNNDLKARVAAALDDLAKSEPGPTSQPDSGSSSSVSSGSAPQSRAWWGGDFGQPSSTGSQNSMRYACFPEAHRLAVERHGKVTIYDTGAHRLSGFSQAQSGAQTLEFSGPDGRVTTDDLKIVQAS